jgi:two-component sensor histidine kinase
MPTSTRLLISLTSVLLAVGLLALLGIVGANFWLSERAQSAFAQQIAARDARAAAVTLGNGLLGAESAQRGFMVGGNEIYLAPYDAAKVAANRQLETLRRLLEGDAEAVRRVERLATLVGDKFGEMDESIALKRSRRDAEALALFTSNRGKALMDEANVFLGAIIGDADGRLTAAATEQQNNAGWLRIVSGIGALVIVAVVGGAAIMLGRYTRELRQARDEVNTLNTVLEQRVADRTADLVQARDRAEVLLSEVNHRVANSLALVSSLVSLQSKAMSDGAAKKALADTQDRIFAISLVHKRLYSKNDARSVTLDEYLSGLLDHLKTSLRNEGQGTTLTYTLEPLQLPTDASVNLGVVVTELVTNAFKYAYPVQGGEVRVAARAMPDGQVELTVDDDGVGRAEGAPAQGTGLGSRIVTAMASSLGATVTYENRNPGTRARLVFTPRSRTTAQ